MLLITLTSIPKNQLCCIFYHISFISLDFLRIIVFEELFIFFFLAISATIILSTSIFLLPTTVTWFYPTVYFQENTFFLSIITLLSATIIWSTLIFLLPITVIRFYLPVYFQKNTFCLSAITFLSVIII